MRRLRVLLFWGALLFLPAWSSTDLTELLQTQKEEDPGAFISSGFYDWRTVSKYRSQPGLHHGYDIAMLAGTPVRAPWPGRVVAVTPWYGSEYGVTVQAQDGTEVTYGHLIPCVRVGDLVHAGAVVGQVAVDHLDVKVRNPLGQFLDIAQGDWLGAPTDSPPTRDLGIESKARVKGLQEQLQRTRQRLELGLVGRKAVEELEQKLRLLGAEPTTLEVPKGGQTSELQARRRTDQLLLHSGFTKVSQPLHRVSLESRSAGSESTSSHHQAPPAPGGKRRGGIDPLPSLERNLETFDSRNWRDREQRLP